LKNIGQSKRGGGGGQELQFSWRWTTNESKIDVRKHEGNINLGNLSIFGGDNNKMPVIRI
jgi:hypothetical protein